MCKRRNFLILFFLAPILCLACSTVAQAQVPEPVGFWRFEGDATDSGTSGNDGILEGTAAIVTDPERGLCVELDGNGHVSIDSGVTELGAADFTIAAWIKTSEIGRPLVSKSNDDTAWEEMEKQWYVNQASIGEGGTDGAIDYVGWGCDWIRGSEPADDGQWHHVCMTWDTSTAHVYVDGVEGTSDVGFTGGADNSGDTVRIGFMAADEHLNGHFIGWIDDVAIFDVTLTPEQVVELMNLSIGPPGTAINPNPPDGETEVQRDVVLSWTPGEFANTHNVYLGTDFDDVNDAVLADAISTGQTATTYDPEGLLDFGQTYYWRIDEVNSPPDNTIFKGSVWGFTTELYAYPIEDITVTSSGDGGSDSADSNLNNVINGSGLDEDGMHSTDPEDMWLTQSADGAWIQFEFDKAYKLHEMLVWNYNEPWESILGFGFNAVVIEYSSNGTDFTTLDTVQTLDQAPGQPTGPTTVVDFGSAIATHVKITANSNFSDADKFGLSEVRFLYIPIRAREPAPTDGAESVLPGMALRWRAGREADTHDVLIGTAMDDLTLVGDDITEASFIPDLVLSETYYWQVLETNVAALAGDIWIFSTQEFLVVDDFESYNDIPAEQEGSNLIYSTWTDGFDNPSANGSTIGYVEPFQPSMESEIVHGGDQSVPLMYDNSVAGLSEVTVNPADLPIGRDWTRANIKALTLYVHGSEDNLGGQLYVKVNDVKQTQSADLAGEFWQEVNIDLASFGVNLQSVTSLTIGIEGTGSSGLVYIDDIRLYPSRCIPENVLGDLTGDCIVDLEDLAVVADNWLIRPLSVEYTFDSSLLDTSGNNRHGVGQNNPTVQSGILTLNGTNFVDIPLGSDNPFDGSRDFSVAMDFKTSAPSILLSSARDDEPDNHSMSVFVHHWDEPYWGEVIYDNFWVGGASAEDDPLDGEWHTVVVTYDVDSEWFTVYLDGIAGEGTEMNPAIPEIAADTVRIGGSLNVTYPYEEGVGDLKGDIDNIHIFNFTLTLEDVHSLPAIPTAPADLNGDGIVDQADQDIVEANMGPEKLWP